MEERRKNKLTKRRNEEVLYFDGGNMRNGCKKMASKEEVRTKKVKRKRTGVVERKKKEIIEKRVERKEEINKQREVYIRISKERKMKI